MKINTKVMICAGAALALAGVALATPMAGLISPLLATGTHKADAHVHGFAATSSGEGFKVELEVEGAATVTTQDGAYGVGGHNGWHSHPGMVTVTLASGSIEWFDENCVMSTYNAGESWFEGSKPHYFLVTSTTPIHLFAWFVTAQGQPLRTDQPAPACAAALGLN